MAGTSCGMKQSRYKRNRRDGVGPSSADPPLARGGTRGSPSIETCPPLAPELGSGDAPQPEALPGSSDPLAAFAALAQRSKSVNALLSGAARLLSSMLAYERVVILDCAGSAAVVRDAAGVGWVSGAGRSLGEALLALPDFRTGAGTGAAVKGIAECEIRELDGAGLETLNRALAVAGEADTAAAALTCWYPLRGHGGVAAVLAAREPLGALGAQDRALLCSAFAILGAALSFATRTRRYARRLKQIRRAKVAWELTVDALPQIVSVLEHTDVGLLMVTEGQVSYCNARFEALLGCAEGELQGAPLRDVIPCRCLAPEVLRGAPEQSASPHKRVCEIKRRDGVSLWLWVSEAGFDDGTGRQTRFITVTDVTEQVVAEQALLASRRKLQGLSRSLISSQEDERKRVAGELHDGVGQGLTLLKLMLQNLEADQMEPGAADLPARLRVCIDKTQEMIEEVRRVSMALRPAILDSGGILLALKRLSREVGELKRDLVVHLDIGVRESEIQGPLKIHVFRIVQEALNNVVRHAGADNVWIRLFRSDAGLTLEIEDDGTGFDPASLTGPARGLGLSSMKQRANLYHGELQITSQPGQGTRLRVLWGAGCLDQQSAPSMAGPQAQSDQSVVEGVGHQLGDVGEPHLAH